MKTFILLFSIIFLAMTVQVNAQSTTLQATATIQNQVIFFVTLISNDTANTIDFGTIAANDVPNLAQNAGGNYTRANVTFALNSATDWRVKLYTDNTAVGANPYFTGTVSTNGELNDGSGLVDTTATANSTVLKFWSDAQYIDGNYIGAPSSAWSGSALQSRVPVPASETTLYYVGEELNNNSTPDEAITNSWYEDDANGGSGPHRDYDANGDGDFNDQIGLGAGDDLGNVFEYPSWVPVFDVASPNVKEVMNKAMSGAAQSGNFNIYFGITDDLAGTFATDQLIFDLTID